MHAHVWTICVSRHGYGAHIALATGGNVVGHADAKANQQQIGQSIGVDEQQLFVTQRLLHAGILFDGTAPVRNEHFHIVLVDERIVQHAQVYLTLLTKRRHPEIFGFGLGNFMHFTENTIAQVGILGKHILLQMNWQ